MQKLLRVLGDRRLALQNQDEAQKGFTLIELLVVVIIIGILAAIAIPVFLNQRESAWKAEVESDLRAAALAAETLAVENNGSYAALGTDITNLDDFGFQPSTATTTFTVASNTGAFVITANHNDLDEDLVYASNAGGLQEWGDPAPALDAGETVEEG